MKRRSISIKGLTYVRLHAYAQKHGRSVSDVVEELVAGLLDGEPAETLQVTPPEKIASRPVPRRFNTVIPKPVTKRPRPAPAAKDGTNDPARSRPAPSKATLARTPEVRW